MNIVARSNVPAGFLVPTNFKVLVSTISELSAALKKLTLLRLIGRDVFCFVAEFTIGAIEALTSHEIFAGYFLV